MRKAAEAVRVMRKQVIDIEQKKCVLYDLIRHSNACYKAVASDQSRRRKFVEEKNARVIKVPGFTHLDLFIASTGTRLFTVLEGVTGTRLANSTTFAGALKMVRRRLNDQARTTGANVEDQIHNAVLTDNVSPRWRLNHG